MDSSIFQYFGFVLDSVLLRLKKIHAMTDCNGRERTMAYHFPG